MRFALRRDDLVSVFGSSPRQPTSFTLGETGSRAIERQTGLEGNVTTQRTSASRTSDRSAKLATLALATCLVVALGADVGSAASGRTGAVLGSASQCHEDGGASSVPKRNGTPCDDGDVCTTNDTCTIGVCGGAVVPGCRLDLQSCFAARRSGIGTQNVLLDDGSGQRTFRLERPVRACAPAVETGAPRDALSHLTCSRMRPMPGSKFVQRTLRTHDRFGDHTFSITRPQELCAPSWPTGSPRTTQLDAYACHHVRGRSVAQPITLSDERGTASLDVLRPVSLCVPTSVGGAPVRDARILLTCYETRTPGGAPPRVNVTLENQLGQEQLSLGRRKRLCVPTTVDACARFTFTTVPGSATCGGSSFEWPPSPPFVGALFDEATGGDEIAQLGGGCAYFGGGASAYFPAAQPASGDVLRFEATSCSGDAFPLVARPGGDAASCIGGPSADVKVCLNDTRRTCNGDADCPTVGPLPYSFPFAGRCAPAPRCFAGAPFPFYSSLANACVVPVSSATASGSVRPATGEISYGLGGSNIVYIDLNDFFTTTPCPQCIEGRCVRGARDGQACTQTPSVNQTSTDCLPEDEDFFTFVPGGVATFATEPRSLSAANGLFCPGQLNPGAFGEADARRIELRGTPAGSLLDLAPHPATFLSLGCAPRSGDFLVDSLADFPGPAASSVTGILQMER